MTPVVKVPPDGREGVSSDPSRSSAGPGPRVGRVHQPGRCRDRSARAAHRWRCRRPGRAVDQAGRVQITGAPGPASTAKQRPLYPPPRTRTLASGPSGTAWLTSSESISTPVFVLGAMTTTPCAALPPSPLGRRSQHCGACHADCSLAVGSGRPQSQANLRETPFARCLPRLVSRLFRRLDSAGCCRPWMLVRGRFAVAPLQQCQPQSPSVPVPGIAVARRGSCAADVDTSQRRRHRIYGRCRRAGRCDFLRHHHRGLGDGGDQYPEVPRKYNADYINVK